MCLIALAWRAHPRYRLALIANRDELHARPAAAAGFDPQAPQVYGGRDLLKGGGWLMASTRGRLATVTNVRAGRTPETAPRSRGDLVREFAVGNRASGDHLASLAEAAPQYGRFNLLLWDGEELGFASNHPGFTSAPVEPGFHAMSNGAFDARWPKSGHASQALRAWLDSDLSRDALPERAATLQPLFDALADTTSAPDAELPDTGVGPQLERLLSPAFISDERYGTRCSTVVLVEQDSLVFVERRFGPRAQRLGQRFARLPLGSLPPGLTAPDPALIQAYIDTDYRVETDDGGFSLRIGQDSPALQALYQRHGVRGACTVTAWNPFGRQAGEEDNRQANTRLQQHLAARGLALLPAVGIGTSADSTDERGFLVLGVDQAGAQALCVEWAQNAVVFAGEDARPQLLWHPQLPQR